MKFSSQSIVLKNLVLVSKHEIVRKKSHLKSCHAMHFKAYFEHNMYIKLNLGVSRQGPLSLKQSPWMTFSVLLLSKVCSSGWPGFSTTSEPNDFWLNDIKVRRMVWKARFIVVQRWGEECGPYQELNSK